MKQFQFKSTMTRARSPRLRFSTPQSIQSLEKSSRNSRIWKCFGLMLRTSRRSSPILSGKARNWRRSVWGTICWLHCTRTPLKVSISNRKFLFLNLSISRLDKFAAYFFEQEPVKRIASLYVLSFGLFAFLGFAQ